jgi:hypothetical protein
MISTSSHPTIPDSATAMLPIRRRSPTRSTRSRPSRGISPKLSVFPDYTLYMQDYGGPVGFRMALAHPERVEALIVQDAVAHNEGLGENWKPRREFWKDRAAHESSLRENLLSLATTRTRHVGNDPNVDRYDPDLWTDEFAFLNKPGQADIQSDLFYDYRTNVEAYPRWQAWMREKQPRLLVIWGRYDLSFASSEPEAYRRDVPNAEVHVLDAGHFALDTAADEIAALVRSFVGAQQSHDCACSKLTVSRRKGAPLACVSPRYRLPMVRSSLLSVTFPSRGRIAFASPSMRAGSVIAMC